MTAPWSGTRLLRIGDAIAVYLVLCVAFIEVRHDHRWWAGVALVGVGVAGLVLTRRIRTELRDPRTPTPARWAVLMTPLALGAALLWVYARADGGDGWGFFGVAMLYLGVGLAVSELRRSKAWSEALGARFLVVSVAGIVASVVGLLAGAALAGPALVLGLAAAPAGISLLSAHLTREEEGDDRAARDLRVRRFAVAGGVLYGGSVVALLVLADIGWFALLAFALGALVLVFAMASRSNADVILVIVMVGLVVLTGRQPAPLVDSLTADPDDTALLVALGDSFMSGEGADEFFVGTNTRAVNECRRAPSAYVVLAVADPTDAVPGDAVFVACSGAKAAEIHQVAQYPGEPEGRPVQDTADGAAPAEAPEGLPQLANVAWQLGNAGLGVEQVEAVLVSIGGNDALFGELVKACVAPGNCARLGRALLDHLGTVSVAVSGAYDAVRAAFPGTPVVAVPYPVPIERRKGDCDATPFVAAEHEFLHDFTVQLNATIQREAATHGFHYLDEMATSLEDLQLCDGDPDKVGVNFLALNGVQGAFEEVANPRNWLHNSMHPNAKGHAKMAEVLRAWLTNHPGLKSDSDIDPLAELPMAQVGTECVGDADLRGCVGEWTLGEVGRFLVWPGALLGVLLGGAWLLALAFVQVWRDRWDRDWNAWWARLASVRFGTARVRGGVRR